MRNIKLSLIYITCTNEDEAKKIAEEIISAKLAACANIIENMTSIYEYKGEIRNDSETILLLKTRSSLFQDIKSKVLKLHSYTIPCVIEIPIINGDAGFVNWICSNTYNILMEDNI